MLVHFFKKLKHNLYLKYRFERYVDYLNKKYYGKDYKDYQYKAYPSDKVVYLKNFGVKINILNHKHLNNLLKNALDLEKYIQDHNYLD
jgi:hypothetical protein